MKRMIVFLFLCIFMIAFAFFKSNDFSFLNCNKFVVVSKFEINESDKIIQNGNQYYNIFSSNPKDYLKSEVKNNADGYVFYFDSNNTKEDFEKLLGYDLTSCSEIEDYNCFYGYYNGYKDFRYVNGKKINFQLVLTEEEWILGFPVILTGY